MTQSTAQPPRRDKSPIGISFFGIAMVMVGIATVAAVAIPLWFRRPEITLTGAAKLLVTDMQKAQAHAIILRVGTRINFDADGGGYQVFDESGQPLPAEMGNGPFLRDFDFDAVFDGVHIEVVDFGGLGRLEFDSRGYAVNDGHVDLTFRGASKRIVFEMNEAYVQTENER